MRKRILFILPFIAVAAGAQVAADRLGELVSGELDSLTGLYEHLHRNPELSFHEEKTAARLVSELQKLDFDITTKVGGHGFVAVLTNGDGPTVMIRTDLDGLPVVEKTGRRYASDTRTKDDQGADVGVMHACAHDIHMTSFVGTARMLARLKADWSGTLVMIGQPAEERGAGARAMLEDGLFTRFPRPDYVLGLHADAGLEDRYHRLRLRVCVRQRRFGGRDDSRGRRPWRGSPSDERPDRHRLPGYPCTSDHRQPRSAAHRLRLL